jgi:hypothetical protein
MLGAATDPPDAGICGIPRPPAMFKGKAHLPHGRIFR